MPLHPELDRLTRVGATDRQEDYERMAESGKTRATLAVRLPATSELQTVLDAIERDEAVRSLIQQL